MSKLCCVCCLALLLAGPCFGQYLGKPSDTWERQLNDPDAQQRRAGAYALGKTGRLASRSLNALLKTLQDPDGTVREAAAFALGKVASENGEEVWRKAGDPLRELLRKDKDPAVRRSAAFALGNCRELARAATGDLSSALNDEHPGVRRNAARALGKIAFATGDASVVANLVLLLEKETDPLVVRDLASALGEMGPMLAASAASPLAKAMTRLEDRAALKATLHAMLNLIQADLAKEPQEKVLPVVNALRKTLKEGDPDDRGLAAAALTNLGTYASQAVEELAGLLNKPDVSDEAQRNAVLALALGAKGVTSLPPGKARQVCSEIGKALVTSPSAEVRRYAAEALTGIGMPAAEPALPGVFEAIVKDDQYIVRARAVGFLQTLPRIRQVKGAIETLEKAQDDSAPLVAYSAALILGIHLGSEVSSKTLDTLERMLKDRMIKIYRQSTAAVQGGGEASAGVSRVNEDNYGDGRALAAEVLVNVGKPARRPGILAALKELAQSANERNQKAAKQALQAIGE